MIEALFIEIVSLFFFTLFGMALIPRKMFALKEESDKCELFLLIPIIGFSVWESVTCFVGMFLPYNRTILLAALAVSVGIIIYRRKQLFIPKDRVFWLFVLATILASLLIIFSVSPIHMNGGIYFSMPAADNTRVCLVNSIVANGLTPTNPYLTYNGELLPAYYHFGLVALAAQPVIMFGLNSIAANTATCGLTLIFSVFICAAFAYRYSRKRISWLFALLAVHIGTMGAVFSMILPDFIIDALYPKAAFLGFFSFYSSIAFSPHSFMACITIILVMHLYSLLLDTDDKAESIKLAVLIGFLVPSAFYNSVYGGILSAVVLAISVVLLYVIKSEIREKINAKIIQHIIIVAVVLILSLSYVLHLFARTSSGGSGLALGLLPAFGNISGIKAAAAFIDFFLFLLPANTGTMIFAVLLFIFIPRQFASDKFISVVRTFCIVCLVSIFFIHSTAATNDYGWRMVGIPNLVGTVIISLLFTRWYSYLSAKKKIYGMFPIIVCTIVIVLCRAPIEEILIPVDLGDTNIEFAEAIKGWEVVRSYTDKSDIVMCNPEAFMDVSMRNETNNYQGVNYFSAFYAERYIAINDLLTTKTSFVGPQSFDEIDELYNRMVNIFAGNVSVEDVEFLAVEQKVKALLVLAQDGLYSNEGALREKYELVDENENYKVYVLK